MTDRELIQQALDALDYEAERGYDDGYRQLRDALRDRLAQPEQCQYPQCQCATESPCLKGLAQPEQEPVFDCPRCGHCCPQSNILAAWMIQRGYATGHGDTVEDLLKELEWQIAENWTNALVKGVEGEREACAQLCEQFEEDMGYGIPQRCADAIRARGN